MKDGHLEFTAKGANATDEATLYWFSINSNVAFPQDPGEEPVKPTAPTAPTAPEKPEIKDVPAEKEVPVPPASPLYKVEPKVPEQPVKPTAPELEKDPVLKETIKPTVEWHKNNILVTKEEPQPKPQPEPQSKPTPKAEPKPTIGYHTPAPMVKQKVEENPVSDVIEVKEVLPNTGTESATTLMSIGLFGMIASGFGLARKKKEN